jgi:hypothetical protein
MGNQKITENAFQMKKKYGKREMIEETELHCVALSHLEPTKKNRSPNSHAERS